MKLGRHFDSAEFSCHDGTPAPRDSYDQLRDLCRRYLEPLRREFGAVTILSGYRTASYNREVGGAPHSYHVYDRHDVGVAADIAAAHGHPRDWYEALDAMEPGGLGYYAGHVHVDNRSGHARW